MEWRIAIACIAALILAGALHGNDGDPLAGLERFRLEPGGAVDLLPTWSVSATPREPTARPDAVPARPAFDFLNPGVLQDEGADSEAVAEALAGDTSDWRFDMYAAAWVPVEFKGTFTFLNRDVVIRLDLDEILDGLDAILEGGFSLTKEQLTILVWGFYVELEAEAKTRTFLGTFDTDLDFKMSILDAAIAWRLGDWPLGDRESAGWGIDLFGGVRYWAMETEVKEQGPLFIDVSVSEKDDWVDPYVGAGVELRFSEQLDARIHADIGGFGIGSASDLTWHVVGMARLRLSSVFSLVAGYRYVDVDWRSGGGRTGYDFYMHGPVFGLRIAF